MIKLNDYISVNGSPRKVTYLSDNGIFEWNCGWANINQLEANDSKNSKLHFKLNTL